MTCDSKGMRQIFPPLIYKNIYAQITAIIQCNPFLIKDTYREVLKTVYKTVKLLLFPAGIPSPPSERGHLCWNWPGALRGRDPGLLGQANAGSLGEAFCASQNKQT